MKNKSKRQNAQKPQEFDTPVRNIFKEESFIKKLVKNGLEAVRRAHRRDYIDASIHSEFSDSVDLDEAFRSVGHDQENRWDYLLGHQNSIKVLALEPHSATTHEVTTLIAKKKAALNQLRSNLKQGAHIESWLWVASGKVQFADTEKARRQLDQQGIKFIGKKLLRKHLPNGQ
jgi:hypothetical protein